MGDSKRKRSGTSIASVFTLLVLWTAFGSVFALLLGYSRIPYAAALDGTFFRVFGKLHPTQHFPHVALLTVGLLAMLGSTLSLGIVIDALVTMRILVQFIGQMAALVLLRRHQPDMPRPFRVWLYPLPLILALVGWLFLFATSDPFVILFGIGLLALGFVAFLVWSKQTKRWPFEPAGAN